MRSFTILLACVILLSLITTSRADLTLASHGKTDYVIIVAPGAIPAEQTAAR